MGTLEKILEEIDEIYVEDTDFGIECNLEGGNSLACDDCYNCIKEACKSIIRKHMTDEKSGECNCCKRYQKGYEDGKKNDGWIPVERRMPEDDHYILLSFMNFNLPMVGRYETDQEGGAFYLGDCDEEDTCISQDLFVNAWRPLPEPYRPEESRE